MALSSVNAKRVRVELITLLNRSTNQLHPPPPSFLTPRTLNSSPTPPQPTRNHPARTDKSQVCNPCGPTPMLFDL